ncbi:MAG: exodeoxyribonuclease VII large subunit, partial [Lachnospiraceae bacterium]|nr:exodeoxyribonuclease VII large subunit [Lachnospiraceae bacterium]
MTGVYSVSQISSYIRNLFTKDYLLSRVTVRGEVSNCKYHSSGHIYFTLKDPGAAISCVMFASQREHLTFRLQDGQQIEASGQVSVYEKNGSYQLYVRSCRLSGAGELYERFLKLKEELEEMGMFDEIYKKPIPKYCRRIGIVTASTGAAIQDIINVTTRRNPYVELVLYPARVQGEGAKESIVRGIGRLDRMGLDVLIVGRGGGSIEDLWAFNEECVARAIF